MFGRIHHNPWQLHNATTHHINDTLLKAVGLEPTTPPHNTLASPTITVTGDPLQPA